MGKTLPLFRGLLQAQPLSNQNRSIMTGVTRQLFTLRADMARLRRFVDSYLNFIDDEQTPPFYFQPAAPFVLFELLQYPYLSVTTRNLIAYPQREISFSIPLECYAVEHGTLVFKQYATCVPFLYVDEALSAASGRDLFGFPKVVVKFETLIPELRPDHPRQVDRMTLRVPGRDGDRYAPFIEVYREPPRYISARQTPLNLMNALPDALKGFASVAASAWEMLVQPPILGFERTRDIESILAMYRANAEAMAAGFPIFPFFREAPQRYESSALDTMGPLMTDIITFKQVRDARNLEMAAFQSIVRSTMYLDRLNDGGILYNPLGGDPTGDVTVKIHRIPGQPIVDSLGLISDETGDPAADAQRGRHVRATSTIRPIFPYWLNVDLLYGLGTNLYWRGKNTQWACGDTPGPSSKGNRYLTFGGGALQEDPTPIVSPDTLIWVLELEFDGDEARERLNQACQKYLENDRFVFRLIEDRGSAWMLVRNMRNTGEGNGPDVEQEVEFAALVQWFEKRNGKAVGDPLGVALMPILVLTDSESAAFTEAEVFGRPALLSDVDFLSNNWTSGKLATALTVKTLLLPELFAGGTPANRELVRLEVDLTHPPAQNHAPGDKAGVLRVPSVALKQVMDVMLPERANFQSIVPQVVRFSARPAGDFATPNGVFFNEKAWSLNVYRYQSMPLVRFMGLKVKTIKPGRDTTIDVIEPRRVWALRSQVQELGAFNLASRLGNSPWTYPEKWEDEFETIAPGIIAGMKNTNIVKFLDDVTL